MTLPFFYIDNYDAGQKQILLNEETSKHIVQVLRMKIGEKLNLTDGKGNLLACSVTDDNKKRCMVEIFSPLHYPLSSRKVSIAISLVKNSNRFEWFLEKATEIGVNEIIPLICERTEKEKFRHDRLKGICISAMLQSQQTWLPVLQEPAPFENIENWKLIQGANFIAHCIDDEKQSLSNFQIGKFSNSLICIGPEGDFTSKEIGLALQHGFIPVSLGDTRLRTETAGVVGAALLRSVM
ncbi:MAG TPA: RsmE family RNA methyltransferase [Chitinophagaceae bacterium]|jgi:16S rRNA (uracil1498-N3)-methyltransferase|nr:RsmE family RNA methyltransferase [Chitinophagaceae bacterium]